MIKNRLVMLGFFAATVVVSLFSYWVGRKSVSRDLIDALEEKVVTEKPQENPVESPERFRGALGTSGTSSLGTASEKVPGAPEVRAPLYFSKFRATLEISTKEPKDAVYVKKHVKALKGLVATIPSVQRIKILKVEGVEFTKGKEEVFELR